MPEHLHDHELIGLCQTIYWGKWQLGKQHEFELIDFFSSQLDVEGNGQYQVYFAVALHDIQELGVRKGDSLILHISKACWMKAIANLPIQAKTPCLRKYAEGKNLYVKVERLNEKSVQIHAFEPREPTEEQLKDAKKFYSIIKSMISQHKK